jgi:hypothetical protein
LFKSSRVVLEEDEMILEDADDDKVVRKEVEEEAAMVLPVSIIDLTVKPGTGERVIGEQSGGAVDADIAGECSASLRRVSYVFRRLRLWGGMMVVVKGWCCG